MEVVVYALRRYNWRGIPQDTGHLASLPCDGAKRPQWRMRVRCRAFLQTLSIVREIFGSLPPAIDAIAERGLDRALGMTARLGPDPMCALEVSGRRPERPRRIEVVFDAAVAVLDG